MCGIFGVIAGEGAEMTASAFRSAVDRLFVLSESRGKESAGLALVNGGPIQVYKQPIAASDLVRSRPYRTLMSEALARGRSGRVGTMSQPLAIIGHSRLVTNGVQERHYNNQPVIAADMVGIHNGIIVNDRELWAANPEMQRACEVDTEVLLALIRRHHRQGTTLKSAVQRAFQSIEGAASVAVIFREFNVLLLATNNGALYLCENATARCCVFASEEYILRRLLEHAELRQIFQIGSIENLSAGMAALVRLDDGRVDRFMLRDVERPRPLSPQAAQTGETGLDGAAPADGACIEREIVDLSMQPGWRIDRIATAPRGVTRGMKDAADDVNLLFHDKERIAAIRRCSRCILPESFPFLTFDADGVCSLCRSHQKYQYRGEEELRRSVERYRRTDGKAECLVGVSGGRDSCYGLHYVKNVLGLNPIAYTYDWGMVTDLARRNISRMCGKLGIEHILVSADIARKRRFIRKNVSAWLKRPDLGMIPLFMAGDKQFYYYMNQLRKQTGIDFMLFCAGNEFEQTNFKTGFCGVGPAPKGILRSLSQGSKIKLASYYIRQAVFNPAYLNTSVFDTVFAYFCSYLMPHEYLYLYHFIPWDEKQIMQTLLDEYGWELAPDTVATWRIGDGTSAFYNYIYHTVAGFTEMDTFRSNQIREGMISREEALELVGKENLPRYEAIKWYLDVIEMDRPFNDVIRTINAIPKRFST